MLFPEMACMKNTESMDYRLSYYPKRQIEMHVDHEFILYYFPKRHKSNTCRFCSKSHS